jgi:outer membrane protein assembly factor BamB
MIQKNAPWMLLFAALASSQLLANEDHWPRFRGPNGAGVSLVQGLPTSWMDKDYAWKVKLEGNGHSSPVVWGERVFVTSAREDQGRRIVQCLHTADGRTLWSRSFAAVKHRQHQHNSWAAATPALDGQHVYLAWASPKDFLIVAVGHDGAEAWRVDLGGFQSGHGFGVSPIVHQDLVIIPHEHEGKSAVVALDRATGKTRWRTPRRSKTTYSTPCLFQAKDRPAEIILVSYEHGITGLDPATGNVNWETDVFAKGHVESSIASPIVANDLVLGASGWLGVRQEVIAVRPGTAGAKPETAYTLAKSAPLVPTPLVVKDLLFLWDDDGVVSCSDVRTGKLHWRERVGGSYYSSPICAGDHIYGVSRDGDVAVLKCAKTFEHVATTPLGEGSHSTPAVAGGTLYLRTFGQLLAIKAKPPAQR